MSEQKGNNDTDEGALSVVGDALGDLVTGIPAPIRNNALKAFSRLCTAGIDFPVAWLEGKAAEKRAESNARVKLINESSTQIAALMTVAPEYVQAANFKFAHKIVRERSNIDEISKIAANELRSLPQGTESAEAAESMPLSDDWLNSFENDAAQMSSEHMQKLFGKILAGEIRRPQSFSIRTLKLISQLDNNAAILFQRFCSLSISLQNPHFRQVIDVRVPTMGGTAGENCLKQYGLSFNALNILQEYGLIIPEYETFMDYRAAVSVDRMVSAAMVYQGLNWAFLPKVPDPSMTSLLINGVSLSRCGIELFPIVDITPDESFTTAFKAFLDTQGLALESLVIK